MAFEREPEQRRISPRFDQKITRIAKFPGGDPITIPDYKGGMKAKDLVKQYLGDDCEGCMIQVNGSRVDPNTTVEEGSYVLVMAHLKGGGNCS